MNRINKTRRTVMRAAFTLIFVIALASIAALILR